VKDDPARKSSLKATLLTTVMMNLRRRYQMKSLSFRKAVLLFALCSSLLAWSANKSSFSVLDTVVLNGKLLRAGDYDVTWTGQEKSVQVSVSKGRKILATAAAEIIPVDPPYPANSVLLKTGADGTRSISEIRFGGKRFALRIQQAKVP
jgi:hypothetical protein